MPTSLNTLSLGTVDGGGHRNLFARCASVLNLFIFSATTAEACHFFQWQALTNSTQAQSQSCTSHETQLWHQGPWHTECSLKWADGFSASLSLNPNPHPAQVLLVEGMDHLLCAWQALQLPLLAIFSFLKCFFRRKGTDLVSGIKECCRTIFCVSLPLCKC